jgi:DNA-directed RNA polymerase subunit N (RpoN/RPB10)
MEGERCISCGSRKGHKQGCNPDDPAQARRNAAAREVLERLTAGLCIQCGATITDVYQVGQSIYNRPCNHRQGMGKAAEYRCDALGKGEE